MHPFNVRVYGILIDSQRRLLVADEFIRGMYVTKLPGGGLEFGEGTRECLAREFMEETGLTVTVGDHFYTTDYFQPSAFRPNEQVMSIYYFVHTTEPVTLETKTTLFDFQPHQVEDPNGESEVFRWVPVKDLTINSVTLPIDKRAISLLLEYFQNHPQVAP
jgi:8-oxo-dGTP diphosphatase